MCRRFIFIFILFIFKASLYALEIFNTHDTIIIIKPHQALSSTGEECGGGQFALIPNLIKIFFCSSSQSHLPF